MRYAISLFLFVPLFAARLETARLTPEASVWFEPNHGQVGGRTEWTARAAGAWLFLTSNEVVYALRPESTFDPKKTRGLPTARTTNVHMRIVGGRPVKGVGEKALGGYSNYFLGKHENEWFSGVPHFSQVHYPEVYPGIDIVFYATGRNVEYDFIVKPGADPSVIELAFDGKVQVDDAGDLVISAGGKSFRQRRPRVFQGATEIEASYRLTERGTVKVDIGEFDPLVLLRVDPVLDFATYLGGPGEDGIWAVATASDGNPLLAGSTQSPASPALDPFQQPSVVSLAPIILKMSADGRRVIFYTILGRNGWDAAVAVAPGKDGSILVTGTTRSANFPVKNAFQPEFRAIWDNGFVAKLTGDGRSLIYSSYIGGTNRDDMRGVMADRSGNGWYIGSSSSGDFPLKQPLQARFGGAADATITKLSATGEMLFSTYLGGGHFDGFNGLVQAPDGSIVLAGYTHSTDFPLQDPIQIAGTSRNGWPNSVLARISEDGSQLLYSTLLAGTTTGWAYSIALDSKSNIWLTGGADDRGLPVKDPFQAEYLPGMNNGYLMQLNPSGRQVLYCTYLNGIRTRAVLVDRLDNVYVAGIATSPEFVLKDSLQIFRGGGIVNGDHAVMKFAPDAKALIYSTVLGGRGNELGGNLSTAGDGSVFVAAQTGSLDYPVRNAYQRDSGGLTDGIFFRLTDTSAPQLPSFTANPGQLTFRYVQGEIVPPAQPVTVNAAVVASAEEPWLRVTQSLAVSIVPAGLAPGIYRGTVRLTPASGVAGSVPVTLNVLAAAPLLSAVEPARVAIGADDTEITLRGTGFTNRTTVQLQTVLWLLSPVRFVDATTLKLTLPKTYFSAEYNHSITVQNPDSAISKPVSLAVGRPAPAIASKGIVSSASYAGDVISPGEILTIFGENFEPGMRVNFDGLLATPLYITPTQMSVLAPPGLAGAREVNVIVEMNFDWRSVPVRIPVWPARPGLFTANSSGKGQAAALNQDGSVNSPANRAAKGEIAVLWGTGGGVENLPTKVFIDGIDSELLYAAGKDGLWQLNVRIPEFASKGEVVWRAGERESVEGVFIALRD